MKLRVKKSKFTHTHTQALLRRNVHSRSRDSSCLPASKHFLHSKKRPPKNSTSASQLHQLSKTSCPETVMFQTSISKAKFMENRPALCIHTQTQTATSKNLWFRLFVEIKTVCKITAKPKTTISSLHFSRQCQDGTLNDHLSQFGVIVSCLCPVDIGE